MESTELKNRTLAVGDAGEQVDLRDAVIELATDRELRESMIVAASELVQHHYNAAYDASWEQLLEE